MSAVTTSQHQPPELSHRHQLHWGVVAALWVLAVTWIGIDPLTGAHSSTTSRWMENVSLLLVAVACTTLIAWLMQYLVITPHNSSARSFELGYHAGRADALNEIRPSLGVVTAFPDQHGRTGT